MLTPDRAVQQAQQQRNVMARALLRLHQPPDLL